MKISQLSQQKLEKKILWTKMSAEQMSQFATKNDQFYKKKSEKSTFFGIRAKQMPQL